MNINTQQMRYFMELAKCLNFTRAAANLYVAQPTLSQQIAELETQLGVPLFTRSSRTVTLTPAGKILYDSIPDLSARITQIKQNMLLTAAGFSGSLNLGFLGNFADFIPPFIRHFKSNFPDIAVKPINGTLNDLNDGLKNQTIDVALSLIQDFAPESQSGLEFRTLLEDALCFVLPGEHPVPTDYSFTETLPLITFGRASSAAYYPCISEKLKALGIQVPEVIFVDSPLEIQAYLESGMGFSVLTAQLASFFSADTQFIPIPGEHLKYGAIWDPNSSNPALPLFLDALEQYLEESKQL